MDDILLTALLNDEEIVLELEDHISEASELFLGGDEPVNNFTDNIYMSNDKSIQYRNEPCLQADKHASKNILNLTRRT